MKPSFSFAVLCASVLSVASLARAEVAAGVMIGEPTGLTVRVDNFPVIGLAWSLTHPWTYLQCDYWIIHKPIQSAGSLDWYLGAGGAIGGGGGESFFGARLPIGVQSIVNRKFELFGEFAPVLALAPDVNILLNLGIGFRYIF